MKKYGDVINGIVEGFTYEDMLQQVKENPWANDTNSPFFFSMDENGIEESFSVREIADILGIELEEDDY